MSNTGATRAATVDGSSPPSKEGLGQEDAHTYNSHSAVLRGIQGVKLLRLKLAEMGLQRTSPAFALLQTCTFTERE